jgi:hypothetical protein
MAANGTDGRDGVVAIGDRTRMIEAGGEEMRMIGANRTEMRLVSEVETVISEAERDERELRIAFLNSMPRSTLDASSVATRTGPVSRSPGAFPAAFPGAGCDAAGEFTDAAGDAVARKFPVTCPGAFGYALDVELPDWFLEPTPTLRGIGSRRRRTSAPKPPEVA